MDLQKIREAAERVARSEGLEVVDVEWKVGKQRFLRVYIDRPPLAGEASDGGGGTTAGGPAQGGVTHGDCEAVSQQLSVILDVEDLVPGGARYILEVSSPGLDRKLTRPADFERFAGRLARIWLNEPVAQQTFFEGRLAGYADGVVKVDVKGQVFALPLVAIRKANLVVEF
jgi:ribosome maturation factor RimP